MNIEFKEVYEVHLSRTTSKKFLEEVRDLNIHLYEDRGIFYPLSNNYRYSILIEGESSLSFKLLVEPNIDYESHRIPLFHKTYEFLKSRTDLTDKELQRLRIEGLSAMLRELNIKGEGYRYNRIFGYDTEKVHEILRNLNKEAKHELREIVKFDKSDSYAKYKILNGKINELVNSDIANSEDKENVRKAIYLFLFLRCKGQNLKKRTRKTGRICGFFKGEDIEDRPCAPTILTVNAYKNNLFKYVNEIHISKDIKLVGLEDLISNCGIDPILINEGNLFNPLDKGFCYAVLLDSSASLLAKLMENGIEFKSYSVPLFHKTYDFLRSKKGLTSQELQRIKVEGLSAMLRELNIDGKAYKWIPGKENIFKGVKDCAKYEKSRDLLKKLIKYIKSDQFKRVEIREINWEEYTTWEESDEQYNGLGELDEQCNPWEEPDEQYELIVEERKKIRKEIGDNICRIDDEILSDIVDIFMPNKRWETFKRRTSVANRIIYGLLREKSRKIKRD